MNDSFCKMKKIACRMSMNVLMANVLTVGDFAMVIGIVKEGMMKTPNGVVQILEALKMNIQPTITKPLNQIHGSLKLNPILDSKVQQSIVSESCVQFKYWPAWCSSIGKFDLYPLFAFGYSYRIEFITIQPPFLCFVFPIFIALKEKNQIFEIALV